MKCTHCNNDRPAQMLYPNELDGGTVCVCEPCYAKFYEKGITDAFIARFEHFMQNNQLHNEG